MAVDETFLRLRAINEANQLVVDHGALGDPVMIGKLAELVEQTRFLDAEVLRVLVAGELRTRARILRSLAASGLATSED